ncbi:MAG: hypothetical protein GX410_06240 [Elusimicrobia bacterium]|nr:hypothetical protein [Elusimicrobiota bacterium]
MPAVLSAADYADGNVRKNDNRWLNLNFFRTMHSADAFGPAYEGSYLEVEGGARSGALDFYFFYDAFDLLGMGTYKTRAGDFFTKIKPRFSLDALTGKDLAAGPVREWYLATQYKGFNGGEYYSAGPGVDLDVPGVDLLQAALWPKFVRFQGSPDIEYAGVELSVNWCATIVRKMPWAGNLSYQGWMDYGVDNTYSRKSGGDNFTLSEFQMFNGFYWNIGHYSVSASVKFNHNLAYKSQYASSATTWFTGAHYHF